MIPESRITPFENRALHFLDLTFRGAILSARRFQSLSSIPAPTSWPLRRVFNVPFLAPLAGQMSLWLANAIFSLSHIAS
jgi:hypothetical protein